MDTTPTTSPATPRRPRHRAAAGALGVALFAAGVAFGAGLGDDSTVPESAAPSASIAPDGSPMTRSSRSADRSGSETTTPGTDSADPEAGEASSPDEAHPAPSGPSTPTPSNGPTTPPTTAPSPTPGPSPGPSTTTTTTPAPGPTTTTTTPAPGPTTTTTTPTPAPAPGGSIDIIENPNLVLKSKLNHPSSIDFGAAFSASIHITNPGLLPVTWTPGPGSPGVSWSTAGGTILPGTGMTVQIYVTPSTNSWTATASIRYGGVDHPIALAGFHLGPSLDPGVKIPQL